MTTRKGESKMMGQVGRLEPATLEWLASVESRSRYTADNYRQALERFYRVVGKGVAELTAADVARFVADLNASALATGSRAAYISAVSSFLHYCEDIELIPRSPMHALKRPRVDITSFGRYLTLEEAQTYLAAAGTDRLAVALMLTTGVRVGELIRAEWRHLFRDPEGRLGLLVHGKGGKSRVVAVPEPLWKLILADRERRGLSVELDERDVFPLVADRAGTPYTRQGLLKLVRRVAERAGLRKRVSPHWLRHSYGTLAALAGVAVYQIQADMGHSRLETSQRYIHWAKGLEGAGAFQVASTLFQEGR
ncbi:MAG: tyrosine-type recombinase/integrase [Dehalococcoidia bacterium]